MYIISVKYTVLNLVELVHKLVRLIYEIKSSKPGGHEANIRGGGKTVYVVFNYLSRSLSPYFFRAQESIPRNRIAVAWRVGITNKVAVPARQAGNRLLGSLKGLQIQALLVKRGWVWWSNTVSPSTPPYSISS